MNYEKAPIKFYRKALAYGHSLETRRERADRPRVIMRKDPEYLQAMAEAKAEFDRCMAKKQAFVIGKGRNNHKERTMAEKKPTKAEQHKRDVTQSLLIADDMRRRVRETGQAPSLNELDELVQLLKDMDARTGKRDPSKRRR